MTFISAILVAVASLYFLLQFRLARSWDQIMPPLLSEDLEKNPITVTVLVPARNEAAKIRPCLESILKQDYPSTALEILCLDNHSEDDTSRIASEIKDARLRVISLASVLPADSTFKKEAITYGIAEASGELIFILDADCTVGPGWLSTMVRCLLSGPKEYVSGPVRLVNSTEMMVSNLERLEFSGLQVVTGGGLMSGLLLSSNGANHGFRKSSFEKVEGYQGNDHIRSGDDLFLLHKLARAGASYGYVKSREAIASTSTQPSIRALLDQRRRWAAKSGDLPHMKTKIISILVFCSAVSFYTATILGTTVSSYWWLLVTVVPLKLIGDTLVLVRGARFFQQQFSPGQYLAGFVIQPVYVIWIALSTLLPIPQEWKGRNV